VRLCRTMGEMDALSCEIFVKRHRASTDDALNYWKKNHSTLGLEKAWGNPCFETENTLFSRSKTVLKHPHTTLKNTACPQVIPVRVQRLTQAEKKNLLG